MEECARTDEWYSVPKLSLISIRYIQLIIGDEKATEIPLF